jgi:hypothetical protein
MNAAPPGTSCSPKRPLPHSLGLGSKCDQAEKPGYGYWCEFVYVLRSLQFTPALLPGRGIGKSSLLLTSSPFGVLLKPMR